MMHDDTSPTGHRLNDNITEFPSFGEAVDIAEQFTDKFAESPFGDVRFEAKIPFSVTSEIISLDTDKIEEMNLVCPGYEEGRREFDGTHIIRVFRWGGYYSEPTIVDEEEREFAKQFYEESILEDIARCIHTVCESGFICRDIHGERYETVDKPPMSLTHYVESGELPDIPYEEERRSYKVGTRRYGIDGVANNRAWWKDTLERAVDDETVTIS